MLKLNFCKVADITVCDSLVLVETRFSPWKCYRYIFSQSQTWISLSFEMQIQRILYKVADMSFLSLLQLAVRASMRKQRGDMSGELVLTPANSIAPKRKDDESWQRANPGDSSSASVTASTQQPLQPSQPAALCRALYDFNTGEINVEDSKYCLSFLKVCFSNQ